MLLSLSIGIKIYLPILFIGVVTTLDFCFYHNYEVANKVETAGVPYMHPI